MKVYINRLYQDTICVAVHGINHVLTVAEATELRDRLTDILKLENSLEKKEKKQDDKK